MKYNTSVPFRGDAAKAMDAAAAALMSLGFRIDAKDRATLRARAAGHSWVTSMIPNPLRGASSIQITAGADALSLDADLGQVVFRARLIRLVPLAIILAYSAIILFVLWAVSPEPVKSNAPAGFAVLFIIAWTGFGQFLTRRMMKRTQAALDTLLHNMAVVGGGR